MLEEPSTGTDSHRSNCHYRMKCYVFLQILSATYAFHVNNVIISTRNRNIYRTSRFMDEHNSIINPNTSDNSNQLNTIPNSKRRNFILSAGGGIFGGIFSSGDDEQNWASAAENRKPKKSFGPTNEIVKVVNGIKHRRLGGSDIIVSEMGLGTQRWNSDDFNAPDEQACFSFMDEAILKAGVNLIDTAEQYPIPSGNRSREVSL